MTHEMTVHRPGRIGANAPANIVRFALPVVAVAAACGIAAAGDLPLPIQRPWVLVVASILIAIPSRRPHVRLLQQIVALYLICVCINEAHLRYLWFSVGVLSVSLAYSAIPLLVFAAGYVANRRAARAADGALRSGLMSGWLVAAGVVLAHMAVLAVLLHRFYGYGYEHDLAVLGNLALYVLVFLTAWPQLSDTRRRLAIALVLLIFTTWITLSAT